MRGATLVLGHPLGAKVISIHAPHAGRDNSTGDVYDNCEISIHAPHAGRDVILNPIPQEVALFQSTRPMRGATISLTLRRSAALYFNPRAPCGRDRWPSPAPTSTENFNPRAPCGRDCKMRPKQIVHLISIHAPRAGATQEAVADKYTAMISIHAPRAGATITSKATTSSPHNFNPRAPCGRDKRPCCSRRVWPYFNPRAPCGRDWESCAYTARYVIFQSTRPVRARHIPDCWSPQPVIFQSTRPVRARHCL